MEMWILNDGFLQRLAQLSQPEHPFEDEFIESLRKELKRQKALELMQSAFLGNLELSIFSDFDPRGDETLAALQSRLAKIYIPHDVPDSTDLSPLLEILKEDSSDYSPRSIMWSEVLAAMTYEAFQSTDLRDRDEVNRLGRGIRDLILRPEAPQKSDFEELCGKPVTPESLKNVYKF